MAHNKNFNSGKNTRSITLFDLPDSVDMSVFNDNFEQFAEGISDNANLTSEFESIIKNANSTAISANNKVDKVVDDYDAKINTLMTTHDKSTSAITVRPLDTATATFASKDTECKIPCATTRWVNGNGFICTGGGIKIQNGIKKVLVSGSVSVSNTHFGDYIELRICRISGSESNVVSRCGICVPANSVTLDVEKKTLKIADGINKTTATADGKKVLTDITLKYNNQSVVTDVQIDVKSGTVSIAIPPIVTSVANGNILMLKIINKNSTNGKIYGNTLTQLTAVGVD